MAKVLGLKGKSPIVPHLEDLYQDCNDEKEVIKKYHSRLPLLKISSLNLKFWLEGVVEDGSNIIEPGWEEVSDLKQLEIDWNHGEDDNINLRTRSILTHMDNWSRRRHMKDTNEK